MTVLSGRPVMRCQPGSPKIQYQASVSSHQAFSFLVTSNSNTRWRTSRSKHLVAQVFLVGLSVPSRSKHLVAQVFLDTLFRAPEHEVALGAEIPAGSRPPFHDQHLGHALG